MRVLMFGWEFPPKYNGGLGIACEGIVNGLLYHGVNVNLVLPQHVDNQNKEIKIYSPQKGLKEIKIDSLLAGYQTNKTYLKVLRRIGKKGVNFGGNLLAEVERYKDLACDICEEVPHDLIHAHDWMTYPAAIAAKEISGKPLVLHIHATELDRCGENYDPVIFEIEKMGFENADKIIAVSEFTKKKIIEHYKIGAGKIHVVHNAISKMVSKFEVEQFKKHNKTVLFLGRITMQKGPEYFLRAAAKVLKIEPDTKFLMAGSGDMMGQIMHEAYELGISENVIFTGFLRGADIDKAFVSADLFVMPSVSEPFGLVALEAIRNGTPVLISKQSGVSEVIKHALTCDFWDIDDMANKIVMVLKYSDLSEQLRDYSRIEYDRISWEAQTKKIKDIYQLTQ